MTTDFSKQYEIPTDLNPFEETKETYLNPRPVLSEKELVHAKERRYFVFALIASVSTYILLTLSITGIILLGIFAGLSLLTHALMLAMIRTNGVKLGPEQFPEIYHQAQTLAQTMGLRTMPDIYVMQSGGLLNAFATRFFGRNMVVLYSEIFDLVAQNAVDEVTFVLTHELAHIKRRHISKQLAILPALWIPFVGEAYSRACEYTCDRFAAYYTGKPEAATHSLVILAIGKTLYKQVNLDKYLEQIHAERGFFIWLSRKLSTHPPLPERIREVGIFMTVPDLHFPPYRKSKAGLVVALSFLVVLWISLMGAGLWYALSKPEIVDAFKEVTSIDKAFSVSPQTQTPPLITGVVENDSAKVQKLLADGADPNQKDAMGWSALHWAVQDGNQQMLQILLKSKANPDVQDPDGLTPLMYAVFNEDMDTVQLLLDAGADPKIKDHDDFTALMYAVQVGNPEITALLRKSAPGEPVSSYQSM